MFESCHGILRSISQVVHGLFNYIWVTLLSKALLVSLLNLLEDHEPTVALYLGIESIIFALPNNVGVVAVLRDVFKGTISLIWSKDWGNGAIL